MVIKLSNEENIISEFLKSIGPWQNHVIGLTFPKRTSESKVYKDFYGIWYVSSQLGAFSDRAILELKLLSKESPKWFKKFKVNIFKWIEKSSPIDWIRLETQDPFGKLKKQNFERITKKLINV